MKQRRVVCAANRCRHDIVILGVRHFDSHIHMQMELLDLDEFDFTSEDQGFVDNFGVWMSRKEAHELAIETDQRIYRCGGDSKKLYSENMYRLGVKMKTDNVKINNVEHDNGTQDAINILECYKDDDVNIVMIVAHGSNTLSYMYSTEDNTFRTNMIKATLNIFNRIIKAML